MSISYVSSGAVVYTNTNPSPVTPAHNVGDLLLLTIGTKPDTAPATTPENWTLLGATAGGAGSQGNDTGPTRLGVFYRIADGTAADTTGAITIAGNSVSAAQVHVFRKTGTDWNVAYVGAADTSTGTAVSATMPSNPGMTVGDMLFSAMVIPTDVSTPAQFSAEAVAATGMTTVNLTEITEWDTTTGSDLGSWLGYGLVSTGTATAAPTVTATAGGTTTNVAGAIGLVRMREVTITPKSGSDTGSLAISESSSIDVLLPPVPTIEYGFEEGTGTTSVDTGSAGIDVSGVPGWSTGNNSDFSMAIPSGAGPSITPFTSATSAWTVMSWFKHDTAFTGTSPIVFSTSMGDIYITASNTLAWTKSGNTLDSAQLLSELTWRHFTFVFDGTNRKMYINATLSGQTSQGQAPAGASDLLHIGGSGQSLSARYFDDFRVFDTALSQSDIQNFMNTPVLAQPEPPSDPIFGSDTHSLAISDTSSIEVTYKEFSASDTSSLTISETSDLAGDVSKSATDTHGLKIVEGRTIHTPPYENIMAYRNPSFETGDMTNWSVTGTSTYTAEVVESQSAKTGKYVLRITCTADGTLSVKADVVVMSSRMEPSGGFSVFRYYMIFRKTSAAAMTPTHRIYRFGDNMSALPSTNTPVALTTNVWNESGPSTNISFSVGVAFGQAAIELEGGTPEATFKNGDVLEIDFASIVNRGTSAELNGRSVYDPLNQADWASLTITESASVQTNGGATPIVGSDTSSLSISEESSIHKSFTSTDTSALSITESSISSVSSTQTDTGAVTITETANLFITKSAVDASSLSITETSLQVISIASTDTSAISLVESRSTETASTSTDTGSLAITESTALHKSLTATDSSSIALSESATQTKSIASSDASSLAITDTSAVVKSVTSTDTASISVSETRQFAVQSASNDTAIIAISETTTGSNTVSATDTSGLTITEVSNAGSSLPGQDTTSIGVAETTSIVVTIPAVDQQSLTINETKTIASSSTRTDTSSVSITESRTLDKASSRTDTSGVTISESSQVSIFNNLSTGDSSVISITENTSMVQSRNVAATDTDSLGVFETEARFVELAKSDAASITLLESSEAEKTVEVAASDASSIALSETAQTEIVSSGVYVYIDGVWTQGTIYIYQEGAWRSTSIKIRIDSEWI